MKLAIILVAFLFQNISYSQDSIDFTWGGEAEVKGEAEALAATCQQMNETNDVCLYFNFYRVTRRVLLNQRERFLPANKINAHPIAKKSLEELKSKEILTSKVQEALSFVTDRDLLTQKQTISKETLQKIYYFLRYSITPGEDYLLTGAPVMNVKQSISFISKEGKLYFRPPFETNQLVLLETDLANEQRLSFYLYLNREWKTFYLSAGELLGQVLITEKKGVVPPISYSLKYLVGVEVSE